MMIDNKYGKAWSHTETKRCPECSGQDYHIFVVFHLADGYLWQCTTCSTQFNDDGQKLPERRTHYVV